MGERVCLCCGYLMLNRTGLRQSLFVFFGSLACGGHERADERGGVSVVESLFSDEGLPSGEGDERLVRLEAALISSRPLSASVGGRLLSRSSVERIGDLRGPGADRAPAAHIKPPLPVDAAEASSRYGFDLRHLRKRALELVP